MVSHRRFLADIAQLVEQDPSTVNARVRGSLSAPLSSRVCLCTGPARAVETDWAKCAGGATHLGAAELQQALFEGLLPRKDTTEMKESAELCMGAPEVGC
jgi:hypothetical protein